MPSLHKSASHQAGRPERYNFSLESVSYGEYVWLVGRDWEDKDLKNFTSWKTEHLRTDWIPCQGYRNFEKSQDVRGIFYGRKKGISKQWLLKKSATREVLGWVEAEYQGHDFATILLQAEFVEGFDHDASMSLFTYLISALYVGEQVDRIKICLSDDRLEQDLVESGIGEVHKALCGCRGIMPKLFERKMINTDRVSWLEKIKDAQVLKDLSYLEKRRERFDKDHQVARPRMRRVSLWRRLFGGGLRIKNHRRDGGGWDYYSKR